MPYVDILRLTVRVYVRGKLESEETIAATEESVEQLAVKHTDLALQHRSMVEVEFLDEPDANERFLWIGANLRGLIAFEPPSKRTWRGTSYLSSKPFTAAYSVSSAIVCRFSLCISIMRWNSAVRELILSS